MTRRSYIPNILPTPQETEARLLRDIQLLPRRGGALHRVSSALAVAAIASILLSACSGRATTGSAPSGSTSGGAATTTVKVGILHSLSGTMSISETSVKDAEL